MHYYDDIDIAISDILNSLGMTAKHIGYRYLRFGIRMMVESPDKTLMVTKHIYPEIAKSFHASSAMVERNIRHCIDYIWTKSQSPYPFAGVRYYDSRRPTNGTLLAAIAETVLSKGVVDGPFIHTMRIS